MVFPRYDEVGPRSGAVLLRRVETAAGTTGSLTFLVDNSWSTGAYEFRYFLNNTYQRAATVGFTVTGAGP